MAYTKTNWVDRSVQYPSWFTRTSDGTYDTLTTAPGTITNAGTPITATALNNLETQYDGAVAYADANFPKFKNGIINLPSQSCVIVNRGTLTAEVMAEPVHYKKGNN